MRAAAIGELNPPWDLLAECPLTGLDPTARLTAVCAVAICQLARDAGEGALQRSLAAEFSAWAAAMRGMH